MVKAVAGQYSVKGDLGVHVCSVRGKVKKDIDIYVGDYVDYNDNVIEKVYERKNCLIRPYVANIDALLIVVSVRPAPDWILVEKLLLNCHQQKIVPVIVFNKSDLTNEAEKILLPYKDEIRTFIVSAKTGYGLNELKKYIAEKLVVFCGQSAVGKSSLINALGGKKLETGELSKRIARGKNTTRHIEIYDTESGRIADTCGFSVMESIDIRPEQLVYYYDEFLAVQHKCKFTNCTHIKEPDCEVKKLVSCGQINKNRYDRYVMLFEELTERRKKLYD